MTRSSAGGAIERLAARALLLDADGRVLLFRGGDPSRPEDGDWWFTPGGGVEPGESLEQAARREVEEETGFVLSGDLGPVVLSRLARFSFEGQDYAQTEHYFRITVPHTTVVSTGWTEIEQRVMLEYRWWSAAELRTTSETVYPPGLIDYLPLR